MLNHTLILLSTLFVCLTIAALACTKIFRQPQTAHANRSYQLDGLRGVLACAVVAHHFYYNYNWREGGSWGADNVLITNLGAVSVSLFFLMSAYLHIGKIQHSPNINWCEFYISRAKRIYPLYIAVFVLVCAITWWFKPLNSHNLGDFMKFSLEWLLFQNTSFQGFQSHLVIAGVQWTLVYEWAVYAIMPIIHMIYHRKFSTQLVAWAAIGMAVWIIGWHSQMKYYWLFILALPAVILAKPIQAALRKFPLVIHIFMIALTAYIFAKTAAYSWEQRLWLAVWFAFVAHGYSFANLLNFRGLTKLGDLSYAIYLLHGMVIFMWFGVWNMFAFKQGDFVGYVAHFPLILVATIVLAYGGHRFVEMPFVRQKKSNFRLPENKKIPVLWGFFCFFGIISFFNINPVAVICHRRIF